MRHSSNSATQAEHIRIPLLHRPECSFALKRRAKEQRPRVRAFMSLNKETFFHFHRHYSFVQLNPPLSQNAWRYTEDDINKVGGK